MNIVTEMILPGGWHFISKDGYRIPLKSELPGPRDVIDAMVSYRLENNLPVGDPEGDLEEYVCNAYPTWCRRESGAPRPIQERPNLRNVDLVIGWANELYTKVGRLQLIPQKEAEERATICKACPKQMDWARDCPNCVTSAQRLLNILRQGKDTAVAQTADAVRGCSIYGWDNRTACHLDKQHLPQQPNPGAPAECWMNRT
jgi:hypothetical protein